MFIFMKLIFKFYIKKIVKIFYIVTLLRFLKISIKKKFVLKFTWLVSKLENYINLHIGKMKRLWVNTFNL